jgi:hypothetical protein
MNEVRRVVRLAAWRLWLVDAVRTLSVTATIAVTALLLAVVVERVFGLSERFAPWWRWGVIGAAAFVVLGAAAWALIRRRRALGVAVELDERAGLREALSTALCVHKQEDPWARAVVETAEASAKRVNVRQAIPFETPPMWPVPLATALATLLVWLFLPTFDVLGNKAKLVEAEKKQQEIVQVRNEIENREKILREMLNKTNVAFTEDKTELEGSEQRPEANDPEAIRRAAVKKLTELTNRLEMEKNGERAAQADAIKEALKQLRQPGPGPLDEFSRALARGDFNKAKEQLAELSKQLAEGSMNPEQAQLTKKQLEDLAKQLEKIAKEQQRLEKKLEQQGLDRKSAAELAKAAATSPEAMQKALEQQKNLSEEQKQKLMEMAKAMSKCQGACQSMSAALSKAAQGMSQEGLSQEGMEGLEQLAQELSESEMLEADMENLEAALSEAQKQVAFRQLRPDGAGLRRPRPRQRSLRPRCRAGGLHARKEEGQHPDHRRAHHRDAPGERPAGQGRVGRRVRPGRGPGGTGNRRVHREPGDSAGNAGRGEALLRAAGRQGEGSRGEGSREEVAASAPQTRANQRRTPPLRRGFSSHP